MRKLLLLIFLFISTIAIAQSITVEPTGITPKIDGQLPKMSTSSINAISDPRKGDMVVDTTENCVKIYFNNQWKCLENRPEVEEVLSFETNENASLEYVNMDFYQDFIYILFNVNKAPYGPGLLLIKYDKAFNILDEKLFSSTSIKAIKSFIFQGHIYIAGNATGVNYFTNSSGGFLTKVSLDGIVSWAKSYKDVILTDISYLEEHETLDLTRRIFISGYFEKNLNIDNTNYLLSGQRSSIIIRVNNNGVNQAINVIRSNKKVTVSKLSNVNYADDLIFAAGEFEGTLIINNESYVSEGNSNSFVSYHYSNLTPPNNRPPLLFLGTGSSKISSIKYNGESDICIAGDFSGEITFPIFRDSPNYKDINGKNMYQHTYTSYSNRNGIFYLNFDQWSGSKIVDTPFRVTQSQESDFQAGNLLLQKYQYKMFIYDETQIQGVHKKNITKFQFIKEDVNQIWSFSSEKFHHNLKPLDFVISKTGDIYIIGIYNFYYYNQNSYKNRLNFYRVNTIKLP
jgi:hypothetical protein